MKSIVGGSNCLKKRLLMMRNCIHQTMKLYAQENLSKKLESISIRFKMYSLPNYLECYLNILTMATNTIFHPSKSGKTNLKKIGHRIITHNDRELIFSIIYQSNVLIQRTALN